MSETKFADECSNARVGDEEETAETIYRDALASIDRVLTDEIEVRFGSLPERSRTKSRVYCLLVVPRNMARAALLRAQASEQSKG